jgi:hypothetical protein
MEVHMQLAKLLAHKKEILALFLLGVLASPTFGLTRVPSLEVVAQSPIRTYLVTPSQGRAGKDYDLLIMSDSPDCQTKHELLKASLVAPEGSSLSVLETTKNDCSMTAKIRIHAEAPVGRVTLWVTNDTAKPPLGTIQFSIVDFVPPGQIPPGVNPPAVDVMWSVMPKKIVGDNFGNSLANKYYGIEIVIGNNSAYNLQLVSVGFELPSDRKLEGLIQRNATNKMGKVDPLRNQQAVTQKVLAPTEQRPTKRLRSDDETGGREQKTLLPTSSYKITRGSLEARQLLYPRTLVLSTITALGPIFTGFTPYFHNINHRGNFTEGINIFSNPLEKGLALVWPDPRPQQRDRFDDQVLRDGLIIKNNTQVRTLAFFPKELLRLPGNVESDSEYNAWKNNAREVRERLGEIVIIGDLIQYVNRISLVPNPPGAVVPRPTINRPSPSAVKQGEQGLQIAITGSNLDGAKLTVTDTSGITFSNIEVDENGRVIKATVKVDSTVGPGLYRILVSTTEGTDETELEVEAEKISEVSIKYEKPKEGITSPVSIELSGKFLHSAQIIGPPELTVQEVTASQDGKTLKAVVVPQVGTKANKYKLKVFDPRYPENVRTVEFEVVAKE